MSDQVRRLMDDWNTKQGSLKEQVEHNLEFNYCENRKEIKGQIIDALAFWRFVNDNCSGVDWETRRSFLVYFVSYNNPMIRVVAMAESLPVSVWRKILWKHNIDFMSFESFLRRIEDKQIEIIKQNYEDLFESEEVPRVFSRADLFFRKITVEKLLNEYFDGYRRYSRKAAMSYNLLNLDFGFNAYPKGVGDDNKVEEVSPLRFLSVKNHADDFVVNQEDGKYWWLYRKARSNYAWRPNREVKIKTHICPGFWYTLLIHFIFWILSPLAFVGAIPCGLFDASWWIVGLVGIIGLIMPLWLALAGSRLLYENINEDFTRLSESRVGKCIEKWLTRNKDTIENCVAVIFILLIVSFIIFIAFLLFQFLSPSLGVFGAIAVIAVVFIYLGVASYYDESKQTSFKDFPIYLKIPMTFVVFCLVYKFLLLYQTVIISGIFVFVFFLEWLVVLAVNTIKTAFLFLMSAIVSFGVKKFFMILAVVIIPIAIIAILNCFSEKKQKKFYDILGNGLWYGLGIYLSIAIIISIYWLIVVVHGGIFGIIFVSFSVLCGGGIWNLFFYSNPHIKDSRFIAERAMASEVDIRCMLKNKWLLSLDRGEAIGILNSLEWIVVQIFPSDYQLRVKAFNLITPVISPGLIERLEKYKKIVIRTDSDKYYLRMAVINVLISQDVDVKSAIVMAKREMKNLKRREVLKANKHKKLKEQIRTIRRILYFVFYVPIQLFILVVAILRGVWFVVKKVGEYIMTLRRLWELFNKRCPYITEQKVLRFK